MSAKRQLLLISSSSVEGYGYLEYVKNDILSFLNSNNVKKLLFIPYALADYNSYADRIRTAVEPWGINIQSIHEQDEPKEQINSAEAIFIGGGNTFLLLKTLYHHDLIELIRKRVLVDGMPYMGISAGTNVSTNNICTTNDMPIVYPPSFEALDLVPFNINPHYVDPIPDDSHKGETRQERIHQYLECNPDRQVLGLREGCHLYVQGNKITLLGLKASTLFRLSGSKDYETGSDLSFLLE